MKIAFSPCPNDTFIFHAAVSGLIPNAPKLDVTYADIHITNHLAEKGTDYDILKISYAALPWVLDNYALLPCGGALGRGCGPLILTKNKMSPRGLSGKTIAIPSERSTAYLLFRLWNEQNVPNGVGEIIIMPFHEIMPAVRDGKIDAGLVIHEARFTYKNYGLTMVADLGDWWEKETNLPIPLGAIVAKRSLNLEEIAGWIRASVRYAWENEDASNGYVLRHAQEMSLDVARAHIRLYVNEFTENLGEEGYKAVETLLRRAVDIGAVKSFDFSLIRT